MKSAAASATTSRRAGTLQSCSGRAFLSDDRANIRMIIRAANNGGGPDTLLSDRGIASIYNMIYMLFTSDVRSHQGRTRPTFEGGTKRGPKRLKTLGRAGKMTARAIEASSPLSRASLRAPLPPPKPGTPLRLQQHLADVLAVLNEMMGRRGFVELEDPRDLRLDRAIVPQSHE